jgi:hypothetical protein
VREQAGQDYGSISDTQTPYFLAKMLKLLSYWQDCFMNLTAFEADPKALFQKNALGKCILPHLPAHTSVAHGNLNMLYLKTQGKAQTKMDSSFWKKPKPATEYRQCCGITANFVRCIILRRHMLKDIG